MSDRLASMLEQLAKRLDETNAKMESIGNGKAGNGASNGGGNGGGHGATNGGAVASPTASTATTRLEAMVAQLARRLEETNQRLEALQKKQESQGAMITPFDGLNIVDGSKVRWFKAFDNLQRKVHVYNDKLMLTEHHMAKGSVFPRHSHPHEQLAYLVSGHIRVHVGDGYTFEGRGGDSFTVRGGIEHQVIALEESVALDLFTPLREDYLEFKS